jgi:hypothetical protein
MNASLQRALSGAIAVVLASAGAICQAALLDNGNHTSDTATGLDWLDLTVTRGQSYDQVVAQMGAGGPYEGWRHATRAEVRQFWINAGGAGPFAGAAKGETNWVGRLQALWGKTYSFLYTVPPDYLVQGTIAMSADPSATCSLCNLTVYLLDNVNISESSVGDFAEAEQLNEAARSDGQTPIGHALVRQTVSPYPFGGFLPPVTPLPAVNVAKAGSGIAVKFSLGGYRGPDIFARPPQVQAVLCDSGGEVAEVEETVSAGGSGLAYDQATDTYLYVWKTEKVWAGSCRRLDVQLNDGSERKSAQFRFK